jgi:hypothetical protein
MSVCFSCRLVAHAKDWIICTANSNLPAVIHRSRISAFAKILFSQYYEFDPRHPTNGNHCTFYSLCLPENNVIWRAVPKNSVGSLAVKPKKRAGFVI